ncbi:hypothetical protein BRO54_3571 [Geobacillus proteiniphilus]|uniref:Uncharacterized protein n=1 Tax=Geobacillus proteiniphilus TaxID=860353 RepID=A0A1Q5SLI5_9BACL|nr:hypothetical protein BRO54_3571 [Geobacillus proteiniphilus]
MERWKYSGAEAGIRFHPAAKRLYGKIRSLLQTVALGKGMYGFV